MENKKNNNEWMDRFPKRFWQLTRKPFICNVGVDEEYEIIILQSGYDFNSINAYYDKYLTKHLKMWMQPIYSDECGCDIGEEYHFALRDNPNVY